MALETKLIQKLSQNLLMTPQLRQAIELLQLGRLEYKEAIEKELLENPVLEEIKESDESMAAANAGNSSSDSSAEAPADNSGSEQGPDGIQDGNFTFEPASGPKADWDDYVDSFSDYRGAATPKGMVDHDERPSLEATLTRGESLQEYIISQLRLLDLDRQVADIIFHIVGNLNRDGYLCSSADEIANQCNCSQEEVEQALEIVQSLEPQGIGARNLSECLMIQLENQGHGNSLEARIVRDHLDKVEKRKYDAIAKIEQVAVQEIFTAVQAIQALEPRPGRAFADETARYIVPDIYVYKVSGEYVISLNEDGLPKLRVNAHYLHLLKDTDPQNQSSRNYLNERLKAASWLIKSIHQRQQTIYKVTESIVKFQREFLDHGISKLKPLVLKEVAEDINMHESTVSRVTTNKFVHTPQGVFELKFFFTTGIRSADGDISSSSVKDKIKQIISTESANDPISDQKIVELLTQDGMNIARRTVAKYRESLGILSSSRRKKPF